VKFSFSFASTHAYIIWSHACMYLKENMLFLQGENWSMGKQIAMFNKTVQENLRRNYNSTELPKYLSECIFLVFIGTSDYETNYIEVYYNTSKKYTSEQFGSLLVMQLGYQLKVLRHDFIYIYIYMRQKLKKNDTTYVHIQLHTIKF
jgi:hypothetical protein